MKTPAWQKDLVLEQALSDLPTVAPPAGLERRIMAQLPHHRNWFGLLGCSCLGAGSGRAVLSQFSVWPANPYEYGMTILGAGFFFLLLPLVVGLGVVVKVGSPVLAWPELVLLLSAAALLVTAGWVQARAGFRVVNQTFRLGVAAVLFGVALIVGWYYGVQPVGVLVVAWLGLSGLVVSVVFALLPDFLFPSSEVSYAEKIYAA